MKTVEDAVKEFKGEWPSDTKNTNYWFAGSLSNMHYEIDGVLKHVCSKREFEDYAKMMELNKLNKEAVKPIYESEAVLNMLKELTSACENNTGSEPSLSYYQCAIGKVKAFLDTRTDKEKLIDEVADLLMKASEDETVIYKDSAKDIINKYHITLK